MLSVELDLLEGEETPRVTVRGAQPLADIAASAALQLDCRVDLASAIEEMARILERREGARGRSEEHTSELQSLMRISYAVFFLKKIKTYNYIYETPMMMG